METPHEAAVGKEQSRPKAACVGSKNRLLRSGGRRRHGAGGSRGRDRGGSRGRRISRRRGRRGGSRRGRRGGRRGGLFLLAAGSQSDGSNQGSQQKRLFHICPLLSFVATKF